MEAVWEFFRADPRRLLIAWLAAMSLVLMVLIFLCVGVMNRCTDDDGEEMVTL